MLSLDECNPRQPPSANTTPAGLFTDLNLPVTGFPTTYHKSLNELQLIGNIVDDDAFHWMQIDCEKHHPTAVPEIGPPASRAFGFLDLLGNPCDPPSHPNSDSCFETTTAASSESAVAKLPSDPTSRGPSSSTTSKEGLNGNGSDKGIYPSDQQGTAMDREARVLRYREKRKRRRFEKQIRYASRKAYAEMRPRVKGRFVKAAGVGPEPPSPTPCIPNQLAMASWFHI